MVANQDETKRTFSNSQRHARSDNLFILVAGEKAQPIDLVVTLGGDDTILHASSRFSTGAVTPFLSFSMGTLGFLLPFRTWPHEEVNTV